MIRFGNICVYQRIGNIQGEGYFRSTFLPEFLFSVHCSYGKLLYVHCSGGIPRSSVSVLRNNYSVFTVLTQPLFTVLTQPLFTVLTQPLFTVLIQPLFTVLTQPLFTVLTQPLFTVLTQPLFTVLICPAIQYKNWLNIYSDSEII